MMRTMNEAVSEEQEAFNSKVVNALTKTVGPVLDEHERQLITLRADIARTWMRVGIGLLVLFALQLPGAIKSAMELIP